MSPPKPLARTAREQSGAVSISLLLWLAVGGVLIYALFAAYYGDIDKFGRVSIPGQATLDLPAGESDISYTEQAADDGFDVQAPADLEIVVTSTRTRESVEIDPRGSSQSEQDGEVIRSYGAVDPPEAGLYELRATSREAATRAGPELAVGESPFGAFGDRLSRVVNLLSGPVGIVLAALVIAAAIAPRVQRALG